MKGGVCVRTIRFKFITDEEKPFSVSLNHAAKLDTEEGLERVRNAVKAVMDDCPFKSGLLELKNAELIERKILEII